MNAIEIKDPFKFKDVKKMYDDSFPPHERGDFDSFLKGVYEGFKLYAFYDNNTLCGMCHYNVTPEFIHLNYIAIDKYYRNKGYGSLILTWLKEKYGDSPICVDVEEIDEKASDNITRQKRKDFYFNNGFKNGKYTFYWNGVYMRNLKYKDVDDDKFITYVQKFFIMENIKRID